MQDEYKTRVGDTPTIGSRLSAGKLAGQGLPKLPGLFSFFRRRAARPEPRLVVDNTPTFHCPEWPDCGCPEGAMRPECPGLKSRVDATEKGDD